MNSKILSLTASLLLGISTLSHAATDFGLPGEFLNFGVGARSMGMGRAFTGVADDVDALYWNPAGMASFRNSQIGFQYSPLRLGGSHQYIAYTQPIFALGSVGIGVVNLNSGDVNRRDSNNIQLDTFSSRETGYFLSYAQRIREKFALGGNIKMAEFKMDGISEIGFGADVGALYFTDRARVGLMVRNAAPPIYNFDTEKEIFPTIARLGGSVNFFEKHLLVALDLNKTIGIAQGIKWHAGLEGSVVRTLKLRLGYDDTEITSGLGIKWRNFELDYAAGFQDLGLQNRSSIKYSFGGYDVDVRATPKVFSPLGLKNRTTFKITVANRSRVVSWIMTIRNPNGDVIKSFQGYRVPPRRLDWDGRDVSGRHVGAGVYTYRMSITDRKDRQEWTPQRSVKILSPTPFEIEAR